MPQLSRSLDLRRPPTSADVARRAGVSRSTVSLVFSGATGRFSEQTRARVESAAAELGYTPHALARSLRVGRSDIVLLLLPTTPLSPLLAGVLEAMQAHLEEHGYTVIFHNNRRMSDEEAVQRWASLRPVGVIAWTERLTPNAIDVLRVAGTHAVLGIGWAPSALVPTLVADQAGVGARALEYLATRGHSDVAVIVPHEQRAQRVAVERLKGALRVADERDQRIERVDLGFDEEQAAELVRRWKSGARPTGIFAYDDEYAMLVVRALIDAHITVPRDMAVIGSDDLPLGRLMQPRLTTVHMEVQTPARIAADTLHAMIERSSIPSLPVDVLQPRVVVRESA